MLMKLLLLLLLLSVDVRRLAVVIPRREATAGQARRWRDAHSFVMTCQARFDAKVDDGGVRMKPVLLLLLLLL